MKRLFLPILFVLAASKAWGVVAFLNNQGGSEKALQGTASPLTGSMSITNSGANRCAIALICFDFQAGMAIGAVTYGGQTMTQVGSTVQNSHTQIYAVAEYLYNPPTGANTLSVTVSGTINDIYADLLGFTGCNSVTPVRAGSFTSSTTINTTTVQVVVPSNTNDLTVSVDCDASGTISSTTNQTLDDNQTAGTNSILTGHSTTAASSVTHTWTSNAGDKSAIGISIDGDASAAASPVCPSMNLLGVGCQE